MASLRKRGRRENDDGAVAAGQGIDPAQAVAVPEAALATEMARVLRYHDHHFAARGISAEATATESLVHSNDEAGHAELIAKRIVKLGGSPDPGTAGFSARSRAECVSSPTLREMVRFFGDAGPTTRWVLEGTPAMEETHADDLADLLEEA